MSEGTYIEGPEIKLDELYRGKIVIVDLFDGPQVEANCRGVFQGQWATLALVSFMTPDGQRRVIDVDTSRIRLRGIPPVITARPAENTGA